MTEAGRPAATSSPSAKAAGWRNCCGPSAGKIKETDLIRCVLDTEQDVDEISPAENVIRSAMHPANEYEAFALLHNEKGMAADDIAARFGVTPAVVRQRLKLGAVNPVLMGLIAAAI
jgi:ParB family chromosome partitioning protein